VGSAHLRRHDLRDLERHDEEGQPIVATIVITGDKEILERIRTWPTQLERVLLKVGAEYEREVKHNLSLAGSFARSLGTPGALGRRKAGQWVGKNPTPHLRIGTGALRSSITHALSRSSENVYEIRVGTNVVYARIHEYGAPAGQWKAWGRTTSSAFPARPFMRPVVENAQIYARVAGMIGDHFVAVFEARGGAT
jgi:phage gpG-like protein